MSEDQEFETEEELEQAIREEELAEEQDDATEENGTETEGETFDEPVGSDEDTNEPEEPTGPVFTNSEPVQSAEPEEPSAQEDDQPEQEEQAQEENDDGLTRRQRILVSILKDYAHNMAPRRPVTSADCAGWQRRLYRAIAASLTYPAEEFTGAFNIILDFVRENRDGVFSERYIYREYASVALSRSEMLSFERLVRLLTLTVDVSSIDEISKHIDMSKVVENLSVQAQQNVLGFYNVT